VGGPFVVCLVRGGAFCATASRGGGRGTVMGKTSRGSNFPTDEQQGRKTKYKKTAPPNSRGIWGLK